MITAAATTTASNPAHCFPDAAPVSDGPEAVLVATEVVLVEVLLCVLVKMLELPDFVEVIVVLKPVGMPVDMVISVKGFVLVETKSEAGESEGTADSYEVETTGSVYVIVPEDPIVMEAALDGTLSSGRAMVDALTSVKKAGGDSDLLKLAGLDTMYVPRGPSALEVPSVASGLIQSKLLVEVSTRRMIVRPSPRAS
jgi:hypothetical protein